MYVALIGDPRRGAGLGIATAVAIENCMLFALREFFGIQLTAVDRS
jgi:hypothetical protein